MKFGFTTPFIIFLLICLSQTIISCAKSVPKANSSFIIITSSKLVGSSFTGNVLLRGMQHGVGNSTSVPRSFEFSSTESISLQYGTWTLHFVTYEGDLPTGAKYCGTLDAALINTADQTFTVYTSADSCANEPFVTMINEKIDAMTAKWDRSVFDKDSWGP